MRHADGSRWARWDLHVHTPSSLVHRYTGSGADPWPRFIDELEALPSDIKVLGINDYIFLDGYKRLVIERAAGRLQNIDLLLPVIELRLDRFGGSDHRLSRVNMHVIFSDKVSPEVIEQQFLAALVRSYHLSPVYSPLVRWSGIITRESLADLGTAIIQSVPVNRRADYGPPLSEGFNNLNVSQEDVLKALEKPYFKNLHQTAIGKTEWADFHWSDQSIAEKKTLINAVDWVFTAVNTPQQAINGRARLADEGVNSRLLDCSDSHTWTSSTDKDRLGNCYTWIQADTEFEGLCQAFREYDARVFIGIEPESVSRVRANGTKYIRAIRMQRVVQATLDEPWFDGITVPLNSELVAIIGNKGSGKSALVDVLALLGDARQQEHASFLSVERFRKPGDNKARHFEASLTWANGDSTQFRSLAESVPETSTEKVTYVPQKLFDSICNELEGAERGPFDAELKRVIFSHVEPVHRLGHATLDELLDHKSTEIERALLVARRDLSDLNAKILNCESQLTREHRESLVNRVAQKQAEIRAHESSRPSEVLAPATIPSDDDAEVIANLNRKKVSLAGIEEKIATSENRLQVLAREIDSLRQIRERIQTLSNEVRRFETDTSPTLESLGLSPAAILTLRVDTAPLNGGIQSRQGEFDRESQSLVGGSHSGEAVEGNAENVGLRSQRALVIEEISSLTARLNAAQEAYQSYLVRLDAWQRSLDLIKGATDVPGTLVALQAELDLLATLPQELESLRALRVEAVGTIHAQLVRKVGLYQDLYAPVQAFIERHGTIASESLQLRINVTLANAAFTQGFFDLINRQRAGSFAGVEESQERLDGMLEGRNFADPGECVENAEQILEALRTDARQGLARQVQVSSQLRSGRTEKDLYDFLFGLTFLEARIGLRLGERTLHQLSPGEKGALLLVFYLLVDRNDTPLLIDQPEENLDNQTVVRLLVPAMREAKKRRQIIIVTHNPNLAVVCDAAQIVCATRRSATPTVLSYEPCGAIENPAVNKAIQDVLEGTRQAFNNRGGKYQDHLA